MAKLKSKRANNMSENQLNEGQGSINVTQEYDVSRIKKLAGLANSSTAAGTPVAESINDDITSEKAGEIADELETLVRALGSAMQDIEHLIRTELPREFRSMEHYTLAHIKAAIGGYGYVESRMSKSLSTLVEDLREQSDGAEGEYQ
jgi:hypothetical protein